MSFFLLFLFKAIIFQYELRIELHLSGAPKMADAQIFEGEYTKDGTVDSKGRPFLRSKGGSWTACMFIFVSEMFEGVAFYGVATNLVFYFTEELHQGTVSSANNVTYWIGTMWMTPIFGAYIADVYLGRYRTIVISYAIYLLGLCFLVFTTLLPSPCNSSNMEDCKNKASRLHTTLFFCSLYVIALGAGGMKANSSTFGADQFDSFDQTEQAQKLSFFNWWTVFIFVGNLFSVTVLVYIQSKVSWSIGYAIPTCMIFASIVIFVVGAPTYRHRMPSSSPFTKIAQVLVNAIRNWRLPLPHDSSELFELDKEYYSKAEEQKICHTNSLRFLDKAALKNNSENPSHLSCVTQVEEIKQVIKLLPIFFVTIVPTVMMAQVLTLFVKQAATLDCRLGPHFSIPPASLSAFYVISVILTALLYDRWFVPLSRKYTKNPRGITLLQRIGIGQVVNICVMVFAVFLEKWRLSIVRSQTLVQKTDKVHLTVFALIPQFAGIGFATLLIEVGKMEFFYDQAPEKMKSLGASFFTSCLGVSYYISSFLLSIASSATKKGNGNGWIGDDLNASHLDYYYEFFVLLMIINLILYIIVSKFHAYNNDNVSCDDISV